MAYRVAACPACGGELEIRSYGCGRCGTEVRGRFSGCSFCGMPDEDRYFCLVFLQCEGNMKDVEQVMGISYPTIKNRLSRIGKYLENVEREIVSSGVSGAESGLGVTGDSGESARKRLDILDALDHGKIGFTDALEDIAGTSGRKRSPKKKGETDERRDIQNTEND